VSCNKSKKHIMEAYLNTSNQILPNETWKDIPGHEGFYQASSLGRIRSLDRFVYSEYRTTQFFKGRILKQRLCPKQGYLRVSLGVKTKFFSHRLIAETFLENKDGKKTVNHVDFVKHNNVITNLEWASQKENIIHSYLAGRYNNINHPKGKDHKNSKKINQLDISGSIVKTWDSISDIARHYNLSTSITQYNLKKKKGLFFGYKWEYKNN